VAIGNYRPVTRCGDEFVWMPPYDFVKPTDSAKQKTLVIQFVGADKFFNKDTAVVRVTVKEGTDYPLRNQEHKRVSEELSKYVQDLKLTFYVMSHSVKKTKGVRTGFDVSSSSTALAGTVISTTATDPDIQRFGKVLPSVGVTLVPVKEAVAPNKIQEQNTASQVRTVVKRLEYMVSENALLGERDPEVLVKTKKMQDEMKQARMQLIDVPIVEFEGDVTAQEADKYFYDPKVNKKYKLKAK